jgi:competence ComEA-like helix-hairpin-helix protein
MGTLDLERAVHRSHSWRMSMTQLASLLVLFTVVMALPAAARASVAPTDPIRVSAPAADKVNINTADVKALMTLQGVGRSLAEKIVQYRDVHGPFKKATDLRKVEGVGDGVWEKNRERVVVK